MTLKISAADAHVCRQLQRQHGQSYAYATKLFPKDKRLATQVLYAFFRVPDELVDNPKDPSVAAQRASLERYEQAWAKAYAGEADWEKLAERKWLPVLRASVIVFKHYAIPFEYSTDFLAAMKQDLTVTRYRTYAELEKYMYGSAAVVGLMMTHIIGCTDKRAFLYAEELGYAMQLTNFFRDLREDLEMRNRIYLPQQELESFGITEDDLRRQVCDDKFTRFLAFQMSRARALYVSADEGVPLLQADGQLAVRVASTLYEAILDKIEAAKYNVFAGRVRTTLWEKIVLAYGVWKTSKPSSSSAPASAA